MNIEQRLSRLEQEGQADREISPLDAPEKVREEAERINSRNRSEGEEPIFEITPDGRVFTLAEPRLAVTTFHQIGAEVFYQDALRWHRGDAPGAEEFIFDEENEAFYTPEGVFAVSRTTFNLPGLFGGGGQKGGEVR